MRYALAPIFLAGFVSGCSSETVERPPPPPMNWNLPAARAPVDAGAATDQERAVAAGYARALESAGCAQLATRLDEDAHFAFAGNRDAHGRDRVVKAHDTLFGAFDSRKVTISRVWLTESSQALEWTMTGVQAREWLGVRAAQRPVVIRGLTLLWTNDDGAITDVHVYFDQAVVKAQLGAGPKELLALPAPSVLPGAQAEIVEHARGVEEEAGVAQVRASLDALEQREDTAYLATLADDVEVITLERARPARGEADARAYFKAMHKAVGQLDTQIENIWGTRSFVVVEYAITGEQLGPIGWMPAQRDTVIKMGIVDVVQLEAGKIARIWRYDDPSQILRTP